MTIQEALRIVYDLASQNALDLDHQDADLRAEALRQDDALDMVYSLFQEDVPDDERCTSCSEPYTSKDIDGGRCLSCGSMIVATYDLEDGDGGPTLTEVEG